jgi:hypothetical protein
MRKLKLLKISSFFAVIFATVVAPIIYINSGGSSKLLYNSDAMYLPILFEDVVSNSGRIDDWYLTPSPYLFPDWPIYFFSHILAANVHFRIILFATLQVVITYFALLFLVRQLFAKKPGHLIALGITALLVMFAIGPESPFSYIFVSAHHYSIFWGSVFALALTIKLFRMNISLQFFLILIGLSIFVALFVLSDQLFLLSFTVPFVLSSLTIPVYPNPKHSAKEYYLIGTIAAGSVAGKIFYQFFAEHGSRTDYSLRYDVFISLSDSIETIKSITLDLFDVTRSEPFFGIILSLFFASTLILLARLGSAKKLVLFDPTPFGRQGAARLSLFDYVTLFAVTSAFCQLLAFVLTDPHPYSERYMSSIYSWTVVIAILFAWNYPILESKKLFLLTITPLCLLSLNLLESTFGSRKNDAYLARFEDAKCITDMLIKSNQRNGIAGYWDAKLLQSLSGNKLTIAQYSSTGKLLEKFKWITSDNFFKKQYDFALLNTRAEDGGLSLNNYFQQNVANDRRTRSLSCGQYKALIYDKFKYIPDHLSYRGSKISWTGSELPTSLNTSVSSGDRVKVDLIEEGYLVHGPYIKIPTGSYLLNLKYVDFTHNKPPLSRLEIGFARPQGFQLLKTVSMSSESTKQAELAIPFSVGPADNLEAMEFRVFVYSGSIQAVKSLEVIRVN